MVDDDGVLRCVLGDGTHPPRTSPTSSCGSAVPHRPSTHPRTCRSPPVPPSGNWTFSSAPARPAIPAQGAPHLRPLGLPQHAMSRHRLLPPVPPAAPQGGGPSRHTDRGGSGAHLARHLRGRRGYARRGPVVTVAQYLLRNAGYSVPLTDGGQWSPEMTSAIRNWQHRHGLAVSPDGTMTAETWETLAPEAFRDTIHQGEAEGRSRRVRPPARSPGPLRRTSRRSGPTWRPCGRNQVAWSPHLRQPSRRDRDACAHRGRLEDLARSAARRAGGGAVRLRFPTGRLAG
ncbi:peptidoglycan-binding domain-containing protein [Micromonospora reichwaldensis]|uniref:peptidoglycan-binding domain-containing protein n=1 Tax=Micromonospora reichwaldensis TaxID=3075516 RepID=UPI0037C993F6